MKKVIKLLVIVLTIALTLFGSVLLYNNFVFYKSATIVDAIVTDIQDTDACRRSYMQCPFSQKIIVTFRDKDNVTISASEDLSTITAVFGIFTEGNKVKVMYEPLVINDPLDKYFSPTKNLNPGPYKTRVYTLHYWAYPILIIFLGPLIYFLGRKLFKGRLGSL